MTLLGNFVEMSGQEENDPFIENKRSERSMGARINVLIKKEMSLELLLMLLMSFILLQEMLCSPCSLVRTKFPSRVIHNTR